MRQAAKQKTENQQSEESETGVKDAGVHGTFRDLPPGGHIESGKLEGEYQGGDLHEIAQAQPAEPAVGVPRTQKQSHHGGHGPEEHEDVAGPEGSSGTVVIVEIVGVGDLAQGNENNRE